MIVVRGLVLKTSSSQEVAAWSLNFWMSHGTSRVSKFLENAILLGCSRWVVSVGTTDISLRWHILIAKEW